MTKWQGRVASRAPLTGGLFASVSPTALVRGAVLPLSLLAVSVGGGPAWADCTLTGGAYVCSDTETSRQTLSGAPLNVGLDDTFSIMTGSFDALLLHGEGGLTLTQATGGGAITGHVSGIAAINENGGALTVTTTGVVTGETGDGIFAGNYGSDLAIEAQGDVTGANSGIAALNFGAGALTITADGPLTGTNGNGIFAYNSANGAGLAIEAQGDVAGGANGIYAKNEGSGALTLTQAAGGGAITGYIRGIAAYNSAGGALTIITTGAVTGETGDGIYARNNYGTDLAIEAQGDVTGANSGIAALNFGAGALTITAESALTGTNGNGIFAYNSANGAGLAIEAQGDVAGGANGIYAKNEGSGALTITAEGTLTGTNGNGITAYNSANGAGLAIHVQGDVAGGAYGIYAKNYGKGALTVTAAGNVSGDANYGIFARNYGTDLTIEMQGDATRGASGIYAGNKGNGALNVTTTGTVTGTSWNGIYAYNSANGSDLTIHAQGDVMGSGYHGVVTHNDGDGVLSITTEGTVTGAANGIDAFNSTNGTNLAIHAQGDVAGGASGIFARNYSTGALTITAEGAVTGTNGNGIYALNTYNIVDGADLAIAVQGDVTGEASGIFARNYGTGALTVTAAESVSGGTEYGILLTTSAGDTTVDIAGQISGGNGAAIDMTGVAGAATLKLRNGWGLDGHAQATSGTDDRLVLSGTQNAALDLAQLGNGLDPDAILDFDHLIKEDGASWTLSNANPTPLLSATVSDGALILDNAVLDAAAIQVQGAGTLGGTGTLSGDVTVDGRLAPGVDGPGALTITGNLVLNGGSTSGFDLNAPGVPGGSDNDLVNVVGSLSLGGALDARVAAAGYYRLFNYDGDLLNGSFDSQTVTSTTSGITIDSATIDTGTGGEVNLAVLAATGQAMQFWDGGDTAGNGSVDGGNGIWQDFVTNWTNAAGNANGGWGGSVGVFSGTAGTVTMQGMQSFDTLQFSADGYVVEGDALAIGASSGGMFNIDGGVATAIESDIVDGIGDAVVKVGSGMLILEGAKSYTGGTALLGGVVAVSQDASLGAATGALTFDGGVLRVTGTGFTGTDREIVWGASGGGFDIADSSNRFGVLANIVGGGDLVKRGAGSLVLTGDNNYGGDTLVEAGTLIGDTGSIRNNIGNAGTVVFEQADDANFVGDIGGFGGAEGSMIKRGSGELTLAGTSVLDWTINAGGLASSAERFSGDVAIGTAGSFTFTQGADATFAGIIAGAGDFTKDGAAVLALTGNSSGFTGHTDVAAGTLTVGIDGNDTAALGGTLDVLDGAVLGGIGTVGTTTIASGGTIAPGNSIGTLNVAGDITLATGSYYQVEVDPAGTDSDLIHATGKAFLDGGSVIHIGMGGTYDPTSTYKILTADLGVTGQFDGVSSDFAFLDPTLGYGANDVSLTLNRNNIAFCSVGQTRNQCATGEGAESLTLGNDVYDAVLALDEATARGAFDQLSGEIHASVKSALIEDSHFVRDAVSARIRAAFGDASGADMPVLAYGPGGGRPAAPDTIGPAAWGYAFGSWGSFDGNGNAARIDTSTGGFLTGIDGAVTSNIRLGFLAGYSHSSFDVDDRASSGSSDNYHLGLYGGGQWDAFRLSGGLAYTWHDIDTNRSVVFPGFSDSLSAAYRAGTFQAFGEAGYKLDTTVASFEPFVGLAHVSLHTDGFTEDGGAAALHAGSQTADTTFTTLGVHLSSAFDLGGMKATAHGTLGWRHAFGDIVPTSTHAFAGGDAFTVAGVPIAKDAAVIEAGLDVDLTDAATLGVSYQGQFGSGVQQNGFNAKLAVRF